NVQMRPPSLLLLFLVPVLVTAQGFQNGNFNQYNNQQQQQQQQQLQQQQLQNQFNQFQPHQGVYGGGISYIGNLVPYGTDAGDQIISDNQRSSGLTIRLPGYFPFYGGRYNYTMISTNGFISFAYFSDDGGKDFVVGPEMTDWPNEADPALIAPYMCRQRIDSSYGTDSFVSYRVETRKRQLKAFSETRRQQCANAPNYQMCDDESEIFLNAMQRALQEGVAGASTFRAESALVVTWKALRPNLGGETAQATFQLVWLTDAQGLLSYTMINYDRLGYDAADLNGNNRIGRCQALFNGGNHTGIVQLDLSEQTKHQPSTLAQRSAVPHVARGRYFHRVDDVVRPAGCSNKTGGTYPLLVYPNIVTMLGETTVEVNGLCLNPSQTYVLMIEQRDTAPCEILNPSIARCTLPKVLDWGTKTVYFQPQSGLANDEKAYIGYIYFVPPTIDPMRLDIGDLHKWFTKPEHPMSQFTLKWYPRNFTSHRTFTSDGRALLVDYSDTSIYNIPLGLYIVGYREAKDEHKMKFVPQHKTIARVATLSNSGDDRYRWEPQTQTVSLTHIDEWYLSKWEQKNDFFTYRFGYFKLAPLVQAKLSADKETHYVDQIKDGMISSPVSLHWLWPLAPDGAYKGTQDDDEGKQEFVEKQSRQMCKDWFEEDGALDNFVRETENNSSCPCRAEQARADLGRFMPHPRCSTLFRDVSCTETLGSMNCYMSAQNVQGSRVRKTNQGEEANTYNTHYGQTCCYDAAGYLMHSSYQPVLKIDDSTPYSPGFPTRSYEFGTTPYQGMFEIPGLSTFHHDVMPYYLCCKFTDFRCQMFYWRRPSSACQAYEAPSIGMLNGAGQITTLNGENLIFNDPGVYTLLHAHKAASTPEVQIQVRMERFPDRSVDFSGLNQAQQDLVQPTNVTVLTGVVLSEEDSDRVHVMLRKDTRRGRYRTSIIVGNVIRYFDTMHLQRFKGVTVYVNTVERGQAEVYVVLDAAQIGVRIRETYATDVDRLAHFESLGLLDLEVSVPPQYNVNPFHREGQVRAKVEGLVLPYPDQPFTNTYGGSVPWQNVNNEGIRAKMLTYRIHGEQQDFAVHSSSNGHNENQDLFEARLDSEKLFNAYADHYLKRPVYTMPTKYRNVPFVPQTEQQVRNFVEFCKLKFDRFSSTDSIVRAHKRCPKDMNHLENVCHNEASCLFDGLYLQEGQLGIKSMNTLNGFVDDRTSIMRHYNSCGAMNIEYPEYLIKGPNSAAPAYLEGDKLSFSCYQTHVIKGDSEYACQKIPLTTREARDLGVSESNYEYRMQWTQGGQPWCRARVVENTLTWVIWVVAILGVIIFLLLIFLVFWTIKQKQRADDQKRNSPKEIEMAELDPKSTKTRFERESLLATPISLYKDDRVSYVKKPPSVASSTPTLPPYPPNGSNPNLPGAVGPTSLARPMGSNPNLARPSYATSASPFNSSGRKSPSQLKPATVPGAKEISV
ncbi:hypothetical protein PMAYCL1PPCAC_13619, partial [Pristionchus mayeri]